MKSKPFFELAHKRIDACFETQKEKSSEYDQNDDRHYSFKDGAAFLGCSPEEALLGMFTKHVTSLKDMLRASGKGQVPSREMIAAKVGDVVNYALLAEGLFEERREAMLPKEAGSCMNCGANGCPAWQCDTGRCGQWIPAQVTSPK